MTEQQIQKVLYWQNYKHICLVNAHVFTVGLESDFAYITKAGYGYEIEIKRTHRDFKKDFTKGWKHTNMLAGKSKQNYFSFCFEGKRLAEICLPECPAQYGVCYACEGQHKGISVHWIRSPQRLHKNKLDWEYLAKRIGVSYKTQVFGRDRI